MLYITLNVAFKAPVGKTSGHAGPSAERAEKHSGMSVLYKVWLTSLEWKEATFLACLESFVCFLCF